MSLNCKVCVLLPSNTKFCYQINGGDQSTIHQITKIQNESFWSPYVWWLKKIQLPHDWRQNILSRHKIGNGKILITTRLVTKKNSSPCKLRLKKSNHHKIGNWILVIVGFCDNWKNYTMIKKIWLPILWQLIFFGH